jgi:hypothetical protein
MTQPLSNSKAGQRPRHSRWSHLGVAIAIGVLLVSAAPRFANFVAAQPATQSSGQVPVLAYYYIWFTTDSWSRAKRDIPSLGPYSSDDTEVMRQHIRWAKSAGINAFLVSWKNTPALTRRLQNLVSVADSEQFKLSIIYEGLDFARKPLPADQIAADLDFFANNFAADPAFSMFGKPLVVWSGTWEFSPDDVTRVTGTRRAQLLILASERNETAYTRLADFVDGDAYYWSSLDPDIDRGFREKLGRMGQVIHQHAGMWIAPAAVGFDARLIGGTRDVDRKDGDTLRTEMAAAWASAPDGIGLISWNEFIENSYIEPSQSFGTHYLDVVSGLLGSAVVQPALPVPALGDTQASPPVDTDVPPPAPQIDTP